MQGLDGFHPPPPFYLLPFSHTSRGIPSSSSPAREKQPDQPQSGQIGELLRLHRRLPSDIPVFLIPFLQKHLIAGVINSSYFTTGTDITSPSVTYLHPHTSSISPPLFPRSALPVPSIISSSLFSPFPPSLSPTFSFSSHYPFCRRTFSPPFLHPTILPFPFPVPPIFLYTLLNSSSSFSFPPPINPTKPIFPFLFFLHYLLPCIPFSSL